MTVLKIKRLRDADRGVPLPNYATPGSVGLDLRSVEYITIEPGEWESIGTGLAVEFPSGFEGQIRPRSGTAVKNGITVLNAPGTIDADFRGELRVILINHGKTPFRIDIGDRIAQLIVAPFERVVVESVAELSATERNEGGLGHTGVK